MNKIHPYIFVIFLLGLLACSENRQHESAVQAKRTEQDAVEYHNSFSGIDSALSCLYDSLAYHFANELYLDRFNSALQKYLDDTLTYKNTFMELKQRISILQAPDNAFRIYSYDDCMGGTMRSYKSYIQYRDSSERIRHNPLGSEYQYFYDVKPVEIKGKEYYLLFSCLRYSSNGLARNIQIGSFENGMMKYHNEFFPKEYRDSTNMITIDNIAQFDLRYDSASRTILFKEIEDDTLNRTIRLLIH